MNRCALQDETKFEVPLIIDADPQVNAVARLSAYLNDDGTRGGPVLFIMTPGSINPWDKSALSALCAHWGDDAAVLTAAQDLTWDDPALARFCRKAGLPLDAARAHFATTSWWRGR